MRAAGLDDALVQENDPISPDDGRQVVRDNKKGATGGKGRYRPLDRFLVFRIERRRGLVEDDDRCVLQDCPGDADPLALATGKSGAERTDPRLVAMFETRIVS